MVPIKSNTKKLKIMQDIITLKMHTNAIHIAKLNRIVINKKKTSEIRMIYW